MIRGKFICEYTMELDEISRSQQSGEQGPAMQLAINLVLQAARIMGAKTLIPVTFAHIDACFYNGQAHVDFARFCLDHGARFVVPAWANNGVVSLSHPELYQSTRDPDMVAGAIELMGLYDQLGCKPVWTCAPYQLPGQPKLGDHIVVGESNAVTYYNSVLGCRTNKYGDYLDVACALVGKAPYAGLHTNEGRRAQLHFETSDLSAEIKQLDIFYHLLGHHVGRVSGRRIPAVSGLPATTSKDSLKAVSTAVAASGGVELWHGIAVTPEAADLQAVFNGSKQRQPETHAISVQDLREAQKQLSTGRDGPLDFVALGTPHFSATEFKAVLDLLEDRKISSATRFIITTSRFVRDYCAAKGWVSQLEKSGVKIVCDICSYYAPGLDGLKGKAMTNSAKWAYYAPGMLPVEVCFGSLRECVESAVAGEVMRDDALWKIL